MWLKLTNEVGGAHTLVNMARASSVYPKEKGCTVYLTDDEYIKVKESLEQIADMIFQMQRDALGQQCLPERTPE